MTNKPDYTNRNPVCLIGHHSVETEVGPTVRIYNADGSSNAYKEPSEKDQSEFIDDFVEATAPLDMRQILFHLNSLTELYKNAMFNSLSVAHMMAHDLHYKANYDEDTLCQGVNDYLTKSVDQDEITPENSQEEVLKRFFPNTSNPN